MDPSYWRPHLDRMERQPRRLVVCPRPDLSASGKEVLELQLRAHDGARLGALVCRDARSHVHDELHLVVTSDATTTALDLGRVEEGRMQLIVQLPPEHGLLDRVLDLIRIVHAIDTLGPGRDPVLIDEPDPGQAGVRDDLVLVGWLRRSGIA